ncbi:hypothetical protein PVAP13_3KG270000 [Panicum virgatum]|uniref:Uncharacterized protein n=1 Tax=Panicum virgatum TaxID=38727 RepID=A0A8T0V3Z0_PANVG|nr:hypothetical protein PVAP13_3KG270000 [Panicum virgatum]
MAADLARQTDEEGALPLCDGLSRPFILLGVEEIEIEEGLTVVVLAEPFFTPSPPSPPKVFLLLPPPALHSSRRQGAAAPGCTPASGRRPPWGLPRQLRPLAPALGSKPEPARGDAPGDQGRRPLPNRRSARGTVSWGAPAQAGPARRAAHRLPAAQQQATQGKAALARTRETHCCWEASAGSQ